MDADEEPEGASEKSRPGPDRRIKIRDRRNLTPTSDGLALLGDADGVFNGKTVLVTGASRGLGAATARAFAEHGADVAITYRKSHDLARGLVEELRSRGIRAQAFHSDQADPSHAMPLIESVIAAFGQLDILVNNARVGAYGTVDDGMTDFGALNHMIAVMFTGMIATTRAASRVLSQRGRIVSVGSSHGVHAGRSGLSDTAAVRAALDGYTRGIAHDLAPRGITANVVHAGFTRLEGGCDPPRGAFDRLCVPRPAELDEIVAPILFLASPMASYITGSAIEANGGYLA